MSHFLCQNRRAFLIVSLIALLIITMLPANVASAAELPGSMPGVSTPTAGPISLGQTGLSTRGQAIASFALKLQGSRYVYGAVGPYAFDCSGFTSYVYKNFGINIGRTTYTQWRSGTPVAYSNLAAGDLVFFNTYGYLSHIGIYLGNGRFINAQSERYGVTIRTFDSYWGPRFAGARRPW